ncbi:MAG TPA: tryptophan synthase subunit alpha [Nitrososphaera sp.]|jgi:tryptophan synthase alpha chain|nr:tryptophan synthase subunit alpha [Nitrososphaera sp.]
MQNRIAEKFRELAEKGETALICYVVAGYPDTETSKQVINALVNGGADIIEVGIPFSDPIADGPTIQAASNAALKKGMTPQKALHLIRSVRKRHPNLPLLAMTYSNILIRAGMEKFISSSKQCELDGFILPDMPVEEADIYKSTATKYGLATVFLVSPNTPEARLRKIVASTTGFLYVVSVYGITGARNSFQEYTINTIRAVKKLSGAKVPVAVGFGISKPIHVKSITAAGADAVIIGSALISKISDESGKNMLQDLQYFASSMKKACKKKTRTRYI